MNVEQDFTSYYFKNDSEFIRRIALVLETQLDKMAPLPKAEERLGLLLPYCSKQKVDWKEMTVPNYLNRLCKGGAASHEALVCAFLYVARIVEKLGSLFLPEFAFHRLMGLAVMIASKQHDDLHFCNRLWASIIGISLQEVNQLEVHFLSLIKFDLHVTDKDYWNFCGYVLSPTELDRLKTQTAANEPSNIVCLFELPTFPAFPPPLPLPLPPPPTPILPPPPSPAGYQSCRPRPTILTRSRSIHISS